MSTSVNRRDALRRLAMGGAGAVTLPMWVDSLSAFAADYAQTHPPHDRQAAAKTAWTPKVFTAAQNATVIVLSELIIPQTETPGATVARVNEFIDGVLADAKAENREKFLAGLAWVDSRATRDHQHPFTECTPDQQTALLTAISPPEAASGPDAAGAAFFAAIKSMTITGYYTSEVGVRQELGDDGNLVFAEFKGCTHPEHQTQQA
jgi:glucoside 3-dehydrogenase (cytochrome c) hitch-hiker subunit